MKNIFVIVLFITASMSNFLFSQNATNYTILLTGASFASSDNGWFEIGCRTLNAQPVNRAIGGEAIADAANRMISGSLYSLEELENIDAFVIMHVHNKDVFDEYFLLDKHTDYATPFDRSNYAVAFDYLIKRYITECYELKNNPKSKYYGTTSGKPATIILCTNWHDSRTLYNSTVRKLAQKWGFPLVEFDKYIGFSKDAVHPVTGKQTSLLYSLDSQKIGETEFGWHPQQGTDKYIQQRMASIFAALMRQILPDKPANAF